MTDRGSRIIIPLDFPRADQALALLDRLEPGRCRAKVGKELFVREGPALVRAIRERGFDVFLDLKFHDIPNTVARACEAAVDLGVWMLNVHAAGGERMLAAAREAVPAGPGAPLLIGVTVLTSLAEEELAATGVGGGASEQVGRLARLTEAAGLDGVVCAPTDLDALAGQVSPDFLRVTPGIRPAASGGDDQRRVATPGDAVAAGASYLVIGRPITAAPDPLAALASIEAEIAAQAVA